MKKPLIYITGIIVLFEVTSQILFSMDVFQTTILRGMHSDISREQYWVYRHKKNKNKLYYSFDIYDTELGWRLKSSIPPTRIWGNKTLSTNSRGIRGSIEHNYKKNSKKKRILIIGDSFTFGEGLSDSETYSAYLQRMIPTAEIINMGVHGYGNDQVLLYLKGEGVKYHPDIVIVGFVSADMERNLHTFRDYAKPGFEIKEDKLVLTNVPVPRPGYYLKDKKTFQSKFVLLLKIVVYEVLEKTGFYEKKMNRTTGLILSETAKTIHSAGAVPVFIYLPVRKEITTSPDVPLPGEELLFESSKGTNVYSLRPYFYKIYQRAGADFKTHGHWDDILHFLAAEGISQYLTQTGLINDTEIKHINYN